MNGSVLITRVVLKNYKSIAGCSVPLRSLVFLVGQNGSGKSNFLDALRFVSDALHSSLDHALRERSGISEVRRRSGGHPNHFAVRLDFHLPSGQMGNYSFQIGAKESGGFEVQTEECKLVNAGRLGEQFYLVEKGRVVRTSVSVAPAAFADRLYLVAASGLPQFRPVYDALSTIEVYNLNPKEIANLQKPDASQVLRRDGGNASSIFRKLPEPARQQINGYLARIVQGIADAEAKALGSQETLEFRQAVKGQKHSWRFLASSMSDGTLRAFGILLALFQNAAKEAGGPLLIGLEEPEMALHPAATGVLLSALREASRQTQILVTSHSPDLLDDSDIPTESLLAVDNQEGVTRIAPLDEPGRSVLRDRLFTPGELLRQNQLAPDPAALAEMETERQLRLFEVAQT
jgi:predicted ATPase